MGCMRRLTRLMAIFRWVILHSLRGEMPGFGTWASMLSVNVNGKKQIWICGASGAVAHHVPRSLAAMAVVSMPAIAEYLPFMLVIGVVTGLFAGLAAQMVCRSLRGRWKHGAWNGESVRLCGLSKAASGRICREHGPVSAFRRYRAFLPLQEFLHTGDLSPASSGAAFLGSRRSMEVSA